jgi:hypothetical protein
MGAARSSPAAMVDVFVDCELADSPFFRKGKPSADHPVARDWRRYHQPFVIFASASKISPPIAVPLYQGLL